MAPLPPYAVGAPEFPLRGLSVAVSRAPLGGAREALLATLVGVHVAVTACGAPTLGAELRRDRVAAARHWMGALPLPTALRGALFELLDAAAHGDASALAQALFKVTEVTAPHLDRKARSEMDRLARRLAA
jgi:hypothetical protein